jgi:hypothetical protein
VLIAAIALVVAAARLAVGQGLRAVIDKGSAGDPAWLDRTLAMFGVIAAARPATYLRFYNVSGWASGSPPTCGASSTTC